jgi:hypothetical protein
MSAKYSPKTAYDIDTDIKLKEGLLTTDWDLNVYNENDVPKIIIIDEWTHYDLLEQDLIQRFAERYGVTVITLGDYD